jgi:hypothetical protein
MGRSNPTPSAQKAGYGRGCDLLSKSIITVKMNDRGTQMPLKEKALIRWEG